MTVNKHLFFCLFVADDSSKNEEAVKDGEKEVKKEADSSKESGKASEVKMHLL